MFSKTNALILMAFVWALAQGDTAIAPSPVPIPKAAAENKAENMAEEKASAESEKGVDSPETSGAEVTTKIQALPAMADSGNSAKRVDTVTDSTATIQNSPQEAPVDSVPPRETSSAKPDSSAAEAPRPTDTTATPESEEAEEVTAVEEEVVSVRGGVAPDYRSPRKAMFLSLLVPGLGQFYAKAPIKAAAFVAIEAACFGMRYHFNSAGKEKEGIFREFHDEHYSDSAYTAWYDWVKWDPDSNQIGLDTNYLYHQEVYEEDREHKNQQYYEMTSKYIQFVHGWDDVAPTMQELYDGNLPDSVHGIPIIAPFGDFRIIVPDERLGQDTIPGYSLRQIEAEDLSAESNAEYRKADNVWLAILANHICSAVDAALTARRFNRAILGYQSDFLDRMHVAAESTGPARQLQTTLNLKFDF